MALQSELQDKSSQDQGSDQFISEYLSNVETVKFKRYTTPL